MITFARSTRPGLTSLMVRLGLPWRLVGMLLTEVVLLFALCCLSRCGSVSFDVNAGRGMLALVDVAAAARAILLCSAVSAVYTNTAPTLGLGVYVLT